jgi:DNA-binding beta-propeller fold protein YncE
VRKTFFKPGGMATKLIFLSLSILYAVGLADGSPAVAQTTPTPTPLPGCCQYSNSWTTPSLSTASGVAVDPYRKKVYVTDGGVSQVKAFNYDGTVDTSFAGGAVSFPGAFAVAAGKCAYEGIYVAQRELGEPATVAKFDAAGNIVWKTDPLPSTALRCLCLDDWGNVYVTSDTDEIFVLKPDGSMAATLTGPVGLGALNVPTGLLMTGLDLYVTDTENQRVVVFTESGANTYSYSMSRAVTLPLNPYCITKDLAGNFYISSEGSDGGGYGIYDSQFNPLTAWCSPSWINWAFGIALDETGSIYVAGRYYNTVAKLQACFSQPALPDCQPPPFSGAPAPRQGEGFIYPSPARGDHATVCYYMAEAGQAEIKVWNAWAGLVGSAKDRKPSGVQITPLDISALKPGVYFYDVKLSYDSGRTETIRPRKFAVIR